MKTKGLVKTKGKADPARRFHLIYALSEIASICHL